MTIKKKREKKGKKNKNIIKIWKSCLKNYKKIIIQTLFI